MKKLNYKNYNINEDTPPYNVEKKPIPLNFEISKEKQTIETKEGKVTAYPGDAIMTGTQGEKWPIEKENFENTYTVLPESNTAIKNKITVKAKQFNEPFSIEIKRNENPQTLTGKPGDWLVEYGPNDFGIVEEKIFKETYNITQSEKLQKIKEKLQTAIKEIKELEKEIEK